MTQGCTRLFQGSLGLMLLAALAVSGCGSSRRPAPATNAAPPGTPPPGYVNPKHTPGSPNVIYNYCGVAIQNQGKNSIKLTAADKGSHDSWNERPPKDIPVAGGEGLLIVSQSGFARSCSWHAQWIERDGYIIIKVYDPYDGHNQYACIAGGKYHCYQGVPFNPQLPQKLDGDFLQVNYRVQTGVCSDCQPAPKYP